MNRIKKVFSLGAVIFLSLSLTACLGIVEIINDNYNVYKYQPGQAVIIVGGYGKTTVATLKATTSDGVKEFAIPGLLSKNIDAFAWNIKVGDSFKLEKASMARGKQFVQFPGSHTLKIEKEGIYYYGAIVSNDKKAILSKKANPKVFKKARVKYPRVFKQLKPINFK